MIQNYYIFIKGFLIFSEIKQNKSRHIKIQFPKYGAKERKQTPWVEKTVSSPGRWRQLEFTGQIIKVESAQRISEILTEYTKYETESWSTQAYKETI